MPDGRHCVPCSSTAELRELLSDSRAAVRRAAFAGAAGNACGDSAGGPARWLRRTRMPTCARSPSCGWRRSRAVRSRRFADGRLQVASTPLNAAASESKAESNSGVATVRNLKVKNGAAYKVVSGGFSSRCSSLCRSRLSAEQRTDGTRRGRSHSDRQQRRQLTRRAVAQRGCARAGPCLGRDRCPAEDGSELGAEELSKGAVHSGDRRRCEVQLLRTNVRLRPR